MMRTLFRSFVTLPNSSILKSFKRTSSSSLKRLQYRLLSSSKTPLATIQPKLYLAFTCVKCGLRSEHYVSKQAYRQGVVIIRCSGCQNNHLIADNLKWFSDSKINVEGILSTSKEKIGNNS